MRLGRHRFFNETMEQQDKKSNRSIFRRHFERVLDRIHRKHYDDQKQYSDCRHLWPVTAMYWIDDSNAVIYFGYGSFVAVFTYCDKDGTFRVSGWNDRKHRYMKHEFDVKSERNKLVIEFELEIVESSENQPKASLRMNKNVHDDYVIKPDQARLFSHLVQNFLDNDATREIRFNFEVVVKYAEMLQSCREMIRMAGEPIGKQYEEVRIAWPGVTDVEGNS